MGHDCAKALRARAELEAAASPEERLAILMRGRKDDCVTVKRRG